MKRVTEHGEIVTENCEECEDTIIGHVPPFWKTPYNHNRDDESLRCGTTCSDPSLTDQSFKDESDINQIVDRIRQGAVPNIPLPEHYGDGTYIPSLLDAYEQIAENNATFYKLDPAVRSEYLNDPKRWMEAVHKDLQEGNVEHLAKMGIDVEMPPKPTVAPQAGSPAPGAPAPAGSPAPEPATKTDPK